MYSAICLTSVSRRALDCCGVSPARADADRSAYNSNKLNVLPRLELSVYYIYIHIIYACCLVYVVDYYVYISYAITTITYFCMKARSSLLSSFSCTCRSWTFCLEIIIVSIIIILYIHFIYVCSIMTYFFILTCSGLFRFFFRTHKCCICCLKEIF